MLSERLPRATDQGFVVAKSDNDTEAMDEDGDRKMQEDKSAGVCESVLLAFVSFCVLRADCNVLVLQLALTPELATFPTRIRRLIDSTTQIGTARLIVLGR